MTSDRETWGMFMVGGVYWDDDLGVVFTVTRITRNADTWVTRITRADMDYPQYGMNERTFTYDDVIYDEMYERLYEPREIPD